MEEITGDPGSQVQRLDLRRSARDESFYAVGGPVQPDRDCYIERTADRELYELLSACEFCHVLAPRQSGKSSLVARCAKRLRAAGMSAAVVDLAHFGGRNDVPEPGRWYYGIAYRIVRDLRLKVNLQQWWQENMALGASQRLSEFFWEVVLGSTKGPVVIFLDGLDEVDELPFAADFFASVRACHDARATEPDYERLAFALVGTAPPRDRMLPAERSLFDIGRRVELNDFTFEEARPLCRGLRLPPGEADRVLYRILYWTGGQPFLTQKVSRAAARAGGRIVSDADVDTLVAERFFGRNAFYTEPNLCRVRETLARGGRLVLPALRLYRKIHTGRSVILDPDSPVHDLLRVAGLVRVADGGRLVVRNRIYANVFSARWAKKTRPTDWRGLFRSAAALFIVAGIPLWYAKILPRPYVHALEGSTVDYNVAVDAYTSLRRIPGFGDMADDLFSGVLARRSLQAVTWDEVRAADAELRETLGRPRQADQLLADFWSRLASQAEAREHRDQALIYRLEAARTRGTGPDAAIAQLIGADYPRLITAVRPAGRVEALAVHPDGTRVATLSMGNQVEIWDPRNGLPMGQTRALLAEDFIPVTRRVTVDAEGQARDLRITVDTTHRRLQDLVAQLTAPSGRQVEFPLGNAVVGVDGRIRITGREAPTLADLAREDARGTWRFDLEDRRGDNAGELLGWSLFLGGASGIQVVDQPENPLPLADPRTTARVRVVLSPDARWAAAVSRNPDARGHALIWDLEFGRPVARIPLDAGERSIRFDASGEYLLIVSAGGRELGAWRAATGARALSSTPDGRFVGGVAAAAGAYLAAADMAPEGQVQIRRWRLDDGEELAPVLTGGEVQRLALGPAGRFVAMADAQQVVRVWDGDTGRQAVEEILDTPVERLEIDASGRWLMVAERSGLARVLALPPSRRAGTVLVVSSEDPAALAFDPSGDHLVTLIRGRSYQLWSLPEGRPVSPLLRHSSRRLSAGRVPDGTYGAVVSRAGGFVVTGIGAETARIWRLDAAAQGTDPYLAGSSAVVLDPRGRRLAQGGGDGRVLFRPVVAGQAAGAPARIPPPQHPGRVVALAFDDLGGSLLSVADDGSVALWDANTGDREGPVFYHGVGQRPVAALARGGDRALVAGAAGAEIWDAASGQLLGPLGPGRAVTGVAFDPSGSRAAVASDGQVQVWDVSHLRLEWQIDIPEEAISLAFSADGLRLAAGSRMGDVFVWNLDAPDSARRTLRIDGPVLALALPESGQAMLMQSSEWLHRLEDDGARLEVSASQLLPGYVPVSAWTTARNDGSRVVFLDQSGLLPMLSVLGWESRVLPATPVPSALQAEPWSERLKLVLDERGAVVPGWAESGSLAEPEASPPVPATAEPRL